MMDVSYRKGKHIGIITIAYYTLLSIVIIVGVSAGWLGRGT